MSLSVQSGPCDINSYARRCHINAYQFLRFVLERRDKVATNL